MLDEDAIPEGLTDLDTSETKPYPLQRQSAAQNRIHAPVAGLRDRIVRLLWDTQDPRLVKRAEKLGMCCISPTVYVGIGCKPTCSPGRCRDRICPTCSIHRAMELRRRIDAMCKRAKSLRMVTLTLPASPRRLGSRVDELLAAMRRLRALKRWKANVVGGVHVVEETTGAKGEHWHVHAHILVEGSYYSFDALRADWSAAVGEKAICHIQAVHDREKAASYVAKYLAKGTDLARWTNAQVAEYATEMHGRRTVGTFGTWHRCKVTTLDENAQRPQRASHAISFCHLNGFLESDAAQREKAAPLLARLSRVWRLLMEPFTGKLEWQDTPLEGSEFDDLTHVMLAFAEAISPPPAPVEEKKPRHEPPPRLWDDRKRW